MCAIGEDPLPRGRGHLRETTLPEPGDVSHVPGGAAGHGLSQDLHAALRVDHPGHERGLVEHRLENHLGMAEQQIEGDDRARAGSPDAGGRQAEDFQESGGVIGLLSDGCADGPSPRELLENPRL